MAIKIKNISTSDVSLYLPGVHLNRILSPGRSISLTDEQYDEMTNDVGMNALVKGHYIVFEGIEEDQQVEIVTDVMPAVDIAAMLDKLDITAFARFIPNAAAAEKEAAVNFAIDKGITNSAIVALIKKYCDVDIINAINIKHQIEEK